MGSRSVDGLGSLGVFGYITKMLTVLSGPKITCVQDRVADPGVLVGFGFENEVASKSGFQNMSDSYLNLVFKVWSYLDPV